MTKSLKRKLHDTKKVYDPNTLVIPIDALDILHVCRSGFVLGLGSTWRINRKVRSKLPLVYCQYKEKSHLVSSSELLVFLERNRRSVYLSEITSITSVFAKMTTGKECVAESTSDNIMKYLAINCWINDSFEPIEELGSTTIEAVKKFLEKEEEHGKNFFYSTICKG